MQMSSRYVRCASNAVDDRCAITMLNDRRFCGPASGLSSSGKTLHRSIRLLARAMLLAAAPYRASGLVHWRKADVGQKTDGTKRTNWAGLVMSVDWGRPEAV